MNIFTSSHGQKCIEIRTNDNRIIPFATIVNSDNSYGKYADEQGNICIDLNLLSDTVFISSVGYKKLIVLRKEYLIKDIFVLEETPYELKEVIVKPTKIKKHSFSTYSKNIFSIYKNIWNPNTNLLITGFIDNYSKQVQLIEKVKFILYPKKSDILERFKIRFRFYENRNGTPFKEISQSNITTELKPGEKNLEIDVTNWNLSLPETGIWIGMEVLGYYNLKNEFIPLENGKAGKANYKNNGKIRKIDLVSPSYELTKLNSNRHCYTKDFLDKWHKGIRLRDSNYYYSPKIEIVTIEN
jgi:hypothetical protein